MTDFNRSTGDTLPIIDFEHLTMLEELSDHNESLVYDLTQIFKATTPPILGQLLTAISVNDRNTVRQLAHRLKGTAANVGARQMAEQCYQLELVAQDETTPISTSFFCLIEKHFRSSEEELVRWLSESSA